MSLKSSTILCGVLALLPWCALAQCDANSVYAAFKQYREQVNSATHLEQLSPYFSTTFNQYYTAKLASEKGSTRYLTHYWDNLNTAQDIVIVYDYAVRCSGKENNQATLTLLAILNQPSTTPQPQVDLWMVKIHYVKEDQQWLIESFEYDKSRSNEVFEENQIVDNFAVIR
ncbi:MAG: hypothetical protein AMJ53_03890 [Gammaproteobacteria bacterium SG8_11]|nr:MAG: hypothetical protein AMJ53_03890 [Gammaproteobacteria bacterium SG8_11]